MRELDETYRNKLAFNARLKKVQRQADAEAMRFDHSGGKAPLGLRPLELAPLSPATTQKVVDMVHSHFPGERNFSPLPLVIGAEIVA